MSGPPREVEDADDHSDGHHGQCQSQKHMPKPEKTPLADRADRALNSGRGGHGLLSVGQKAEKSDSGPVEGQEASALLHCMIGDVKDDLGLSGDRTEIAGQRLDHGLDLLARVIDGVGQPQARPVRPEPPERQRSSGKNRHPSSADRVPGPAPTHRPSRTRAGWRRC